MRREEIGIFLAIGLFMLLQRCFHSIGEFSADATALIMTLVPSGVCFGLRKALKNGISPIDLIVLSALTGIIAYGL